MQGAGKHSGWSGSDEFREGGHLCATCPQVPRVLFVRAEIRELKPRPGQRPGATWGTGQLERQRTGLVFHSASYWLWDVGEWTSAH